MIHARPDYDRIQDPADEFRIMSPSFCSVLRIAIPPLWHGSTLIWSNPKTAIRDPEIIAAIRRHIPFIEAWQPKKSPDMPR